MSAIQKLCVALTAKSEQHLKLLGMLKKEQGEIQAVTDHIKNVELSKIKANTIQLDDRQRQFQTETDKAIAGTQEKLKSMVRF